MKSPAGYIMKSPAGYIFRHPKVVSFVMNASTDTAILQLMNQAHGVVADLAPHGHDVVAGGQQDAPALAVAKGVNQGYASQFGIGRSTS
jgi:hypothetical protein